MSLRETMNRNPGITTGITVGIVVIALVLIIYQLMPARIPSGEKAWYTSDDGQTWFKDSASLYAPINHDGKDAYKAWVFKCGGTKFVGYMERWTPEGKKKVEEAKAKNDIAPGYIRMLSEQFVQIKKPGEKDWVTSDDVQKSRNVTKVVCPDGKTKVEAVYAD